MLVPGGTFMTALEMAGGAMDERQLAIVEHLHMKCPDRAGLLALMEKAGFEDARVEFEPERRWLCGFGRKPVHTSK